MALDPKTEQNLEAIGKVLGLLIFKVICYAISSGLLYAILVPMIGLHVTYLQVLGVVILIDFLKGYFSK